MSPPTALPLDPEEPLPREDNPADLRGRMIEDVAGGDIGRKSGRGALISLGSRLTSLLLTLVAQAVLGRLLNPADYGIYAMGVTGLSFLLIFREFGLQAAGVQKETLSYDEASFLFWANLLLIGSLGAIGVVAAPFVAMWYGSPAVTPVLITMSVAAVLGGVSAQHTMILRRQLRFSSIAIIDVVALGCGVVAGLIVGWQRRDVTALLAMYVVQQGMTSLLTVGISRWIPYRPHLASAHMPMLRFGAGITAVNVLYYFTNNIGAILIGRTLGTFLLGHYNRAQQLYQIPSTVLFSSVYVVVFASLARLCGSPDAYRAFYAATLRRVSMFYMLLSGILIFAGDDLVRVLIGPGWDIAGRMLEIFAVALVGSGMAQMGGMLYQTQARLKEFQLWGIIDSVIRISFIVGGSWWGIYGLAVGFAFSTTFVTAPISLWFVGRNGPVGLRDQIESIKPGAVIFLLSIAGSGLGQAISPYHGPHFWTLILECVGSLGLVGGIGMLLPITRNAFREVFTGIYDLLPGRMRRLVSGSVEQVDPTSATYPTRTPSLANAGLQHRNDYIQYLRGFAALMVVLDHSMLRVAKVDPRYGWLEAFAGDFGAMGVQIFFVISGFIMVTIAYDGFGKPGAVPKFWLARLKRIVPLYYIATAIALAMPAALAGRGFALGETARSLLFIASNARPDEGALHPVLSVGWTLNYEMFFYLLFGLGLFLPRRLGLAFSLGVLGALVIAGELTARSASPAGPLTPVYFYTYHIVALFAAGMVLAIWRRSRFFITLPVRFPAVIGAGLAAAAVIVLDLIMPGQYPLWRTLLFYGLAALPVALCVAARARPPRRLLELIGNASFSMYLFHGFALTIVNVAWHAAIGFDHPLAQILLCILFGSATGVLVYRFVEQPLVRLLKPRSRQAREG